MNFVCLTFSKKFVDFFSAIRFPWKYYLTNHQHYPCILIWYKKIWTSFCSKQCTFRCTLVSVDHIKRTLYTYSQILEANVNSQSTIQEISNRQTMSRDQTVRGNFFSGLTKVQLIMWEVRQAFHIGKVEPKLPAYYKNVINLYSN